MSAADTRRSQGTSTSDDRSATEIDSRKKRSEWWEPSQNGRENRAKEGTASCGRILVQKRVNDSAHPQEAIDSGRKSGNPFEKAAQQRRADRKKSGHQQPAEFKPQIRSTASRFAFLSPNRQTQRATPPRIKQRPPTIRRRQSRAVDLSNSNHGSRASPKALGVNSVK